MKNRCVGKKRKSMKGKKVGVSPPKIKTPVIYFNGTYFIEGRIVPVFAPLFLILFLFCLYAKKVQFSKSPSFPPPKASPSRPLVTEKLEEKNYEPR